MHIGDKVRLLHDKQEGIIVKMIRADLAEVEIEEGFSIPVLTKELVIVNSNDSITNHVRTITKENTNLPSKNEVIASKGIYLAMLPENEVWFDIVLINNTDFGLSYTAHEKQQNLVSGLSAGFVKSKSSISLVKHWDMREKKPTDMILLRCLYFHKGLSSDRSVFETLVSLLEILKLPSEENIPLIKGKCKWLQLDKKVEKDSIAYSRYGNKAISKPTIKSESGEASEIDLHIEQLVENPLRLDSTEMLAIQISKFEQSLQRAIDQRKPYIIFIHGVGAGVLRTEIHKRLSVNKQIKYFEDAQKEKFGFGATKVQIT